METGIDPKCISSEQSTNKLKLVDTSDVIATEQNKPQPKGLIFTPEEKKRLTDFFALLIEIDRRENVTKFYDKPTK
jgi:ATP:corrinoid adenosyltransferase